jgi:hypothetical protein
MGLEPNRWYPIDKSKEFPDYGKLLAQIKEFIDARYDFELSDCYKKVRILAPVKQGVVLWHKEKELPEGYRVEKLTRGHQEEVVCKGRSILVEHSGTSYRIFKNDILISIET